jgi:hypothetical protein
MKDRRRGSRPIIPLKEEKFLSVSTVISQWY